MDEGRFQSGKATMSSLCRRGSIRPEKLKVRYFASLAERRTTYERLTARLFLNVMRM